MDPLSRPRIDYVGIQGGGGVLPTVLCVSMSTCVLQLCLLDKDSFGNYTSFTKTYCNAKQGPFGWDVSGASNVPQLHALLKKVRGHKRGNMSF